MPRSVSAPVLLLQLVGRAAQTVSERGSGGKRACVRKGVESRPDDRGVGTWSSARQVAHYLPRALPASLEGLATLALDLRWCWHHGTDALWRGIDREVWEATANPWLILETVSDQRLQTLEGDPQFMSELRRQLADRESHLAADTWFGSRPELFRGTVAYFSMEFGLGESLPIYSGGLGVLAGDHLKTACDLGVPLVGIGLLYQQGYFRQALNAQGEQIEFYPYNDPTMLPVVPLRDASDDASGEWVHVIVELPGRP